MKVGLIRLVYCTSYYCLSGSLWYKPVTVYFTFVVLSVCDYHFFWNNFCHRSKLDWQFMISGSGSSCWIPKPWRSRGHSATLVKGTCWCSLWLSREQELWWIKERFRTYAREGWQSSKAAGSGICWCSPKYSKFNLSTGWTFLFRIYLMLFSMQVQELMRHLWSFWNGKGTCIICCKLMRYV